MHPPQWATSHRVPDNAVGGARRYDALDNLNRVQVTGGTQVRDQYYCYNSKNQLDFVRTGSNCASSPAVTALGYDVQAT